MTYDDGILTISRVINRAEPGNKPMMRLEEKEKYYYGYEELGVTRYYQAKNANQQIECVVRIQGWEDVKVTDICILEGGAQYQIGMVQPTHDENGLRMMRLTLERVGQNYEVS